MLKLVALCVCLVAAGGCASSKGQIVLDCTLDAGAPIPDEIIKALASDNFEDAIAKLTFPVGKFLAEDIACIVSNFMKSNSPKLQADPNLAKEKEHARDYLTRRHYVVK